MEPYLDRLAAVEDYPPMKDGWTSEEFVEDFLQRRVNNTRLEMKDSPFQVCVSKISDNGIGQP